MRWPPTGFGEQWNAIIYFKETRDILGLNWRTRNYRKLWQNNLGNMGEKVSFSKGRWNMPPPNFQRKFYDPEHYSVVMVSNDGTVKLPNEARKWPACFNLFWLTATVLSKQEVFSILFIQSRCFDTNLYWLRCQLSENNFYKNWSLNPVRVLDICLEMRSDSK